MRTTYFFQVLLLILLPINGFTQISTSEKEKQELIAELTKQVLDSIEKSKKPGEISKNLNVSIYLESYYSYDFAKPDNHRRQPFAYSYNRCNEIQINLAFLKLAYTAEKIRANLAFMAGSYSYDNLANEVGVMKNVFEANIGVKLSKKKNLWLDVGIFPSHIGFESAIGKDCWNLTRSILADNSPYYESGAKISYITPNEKWLFSGLILNGWQRIYRLDGNNSPAIGHQITFKPNTKISLNSSSFIGNDKADSLFQLRIFHNLYGQFQLSEKVGLTAGFDIGMQQKSKGSSDYNFWFSPVLIAKFALALKHSLAIRGEYYSDKNEVIITTGTTHGFQTIGYSLNYDFQITENLLWRVEARGFSSKDEIFTLNKQPSKQNVFFTTSLALYL